jgi:pyrimidine dimer DNA glycosylase
MRLWSLHPKYLDPQGLVALWREALLAQAVLRGRTRGYRSHPQLQRFRERPAPVSAINAYLKAVYHEAASRGYQFDKSKIGPVRKKQRIAVTSAQLEHEWQHLLAKLKARNRLQYRKCRALKTPQCHPLLYVRPGRIESWERLP